MTTPAKTWTGRTFLVWISGFFAVIFAVNGVFLWLASESWSGLSAENSYRRGIDYNRVIERAERQAALGWTVKAVFENGVEQTGRFLLTATAPGGLPIANREVVATFVRPVAEGLDFKVGLEPIEGGRYAADVALPAAGQWDVRAEISRPGSDAYIVETRIWSK